MKIFWYLRRRLTDLGRAVWISSRKCLHCLHWVSGFCRYEKRHDDFALARILAALLALFIGAALYGESHASNSGMIVGIAGMVIGIASYVLLAFAAPPMFYYTGLLVAKIASRIFRQFRAIFQREAAVYREEADKVRAVLAEQSDPKNRLGRPVVDPVPPETLLRPASSEVADTANLVRPFQQGSAGSDSIEQNEVCIRAG